MVVSYLFYALWKQADPYQASYDRYRSLYISSMEYLA